MEKETKKKHFVLVHGASLGAWSWYKVVALLKSVGHTVTALDMAASGINPKTPEEVHSAMDYSEPLMEFMEGLPEGERVILVGHSFGGGSIALAMEKFPKKIAVAVFVAAFMPCLGIDMDPIYIKYMRPKEFYMDYEYKFSEDHKQLIWMQFGPNFMSTRMFQLCSPQDFELALSLVRPQPGSVNPSDVEKHDLTEDNYGSVPRVFIQLENDEMTNLPVDEFRLQNYPPQEVNTIPNADHMVMLSNPQHLSSCFHQISQKYH
ncbi:hypothetical protein M9H77_34091 [Catharanthus roseus]|uniref:Uncharacterized protein n=1 Tax=Catharanthus roseus TaxID=4058 RepID=A0ACB9ZMM8_CATRO|nr:hypothetical protein M9H77_34091 [Catharanthus roseus]